MQTDSAGNVTWQDLSAGAERINDLIDGRSDNDGTNDGSSIFLGIGAGANDDLSDNRNIGIGLNALNTNTSGDKNIAIGYGTLENNLTGFDNIGIGNETLVNSIIGSKNIAIGTNALYSTTGGNNLAIGERALYSNTTGIGNIALGNQALENNTIGQYSIGIGLLTLRQNTGALNTAIGTVSLSSNTTGSNNTALGYGALHLNVVGGDNVAIGFAAGFNELGSNTLYIENTDADSNNALIYGEFGTNNTATGNILRTNSEFQIGNPTINGYAFPTTDGTANQVLQTDGTGNLSWQNATNAGYWSRIGTTLNLQNPGDDITFTNDQTTITFAESAGSPAPMMHMFSGGFSNSNKMVIAHSNGFNNWGLQYNDVDDAFNFLSNGNPVVKIDLQTAVGEPRVLVTGNLQVTGDLITDTNTYPDYVFDTYFNKKSQLDPNYTFLSLTDTEQFIKANGHLPNVKSYNDIKKAGMKINLQDVALKNLEKIEEAYLYIIELKNQNEALKKELNKYKDLDKRLKALEKNKN